MKTWISLSKHSLEEYYAQIRKAVDDAVALETSKEEEQSEQESAVKEQAKRAARALAPASDKINVRSDIVAPIRGTTS